MIDLKAIRARDALISQVWNGEPTGQADQDRRALIKAYDELVAERALLVTRAENAEAAMVEAERDAERYRWLRDEQPNECCCSWSKHLMDVPNTEFDAAIDAVMEEP